jgi:Reverse transcriptase (RNA-dependent DNA polymerase)
MDEELHALEKNQTWEICFLPKNKKSVGCKWIYKIKYRSDGTIERYKARLVAKGTPKPMVSIIMSPLHLWQKCIP